jgi:hypothetical protein
MKKPLITVHANYIVGNAAKRDALKHQGFWLTKWPQEPGCLPYDREIP